MAPSAQPAPAPRNRLLAALPPEDLERRRPRLQPVELPIHQTLQVPGEPVAAVHFPETGWASMLATLDVCDAYDVG